MSGPKCVDVNPRPNYQDVRVSINRDEQAELNAILAKIPGVTFMGTAVRVQDSSRVTLAQVRQYIEDARKKVREENERRRLAQLAESKQREKARVSSVINSVRINAQKHTENVKTAIARCESALRNADIADTNFSILTNISIKSHTFKLKSEVEHLNTELSKIDKICEQKIKALEQYSKTIDSHLFIEDLNRAIAKSPSDILEFSYDEQNAIQTVGLIADATSQFKVLKVHLEKIEKIISENADMQTLVPKINSIIKSCEVTKKDSINNCINGISVVEKKFIAEQKGKIISEALSAAVSNLDGVNEGLLIPKDTVSLRNAGIEDSCKAHINQAKEIIAKIDALGYLSDKHKSNFTSLKTIVGSRSVFSAATERNLAVAVDELNKIFNATSIDAKNFQEYQEYYKIFKRVVNEFGEASSILKPSEISFDASDAKNRISLIKAESDRIVKAARVFRRNVTTEQIKIDRRSNDKEQFVLFEERIGDIEENNRLLYVQKGVFGVMYEYIIQPGGNFRIIPYGVEESDGKPLIDEESHIASMKRDCSEIKRITASLAEMGYAQEKIDITEEQTPEDYAKNGKFFRLKNKEEITRYIKAVSEDGNQEYYEKLFRMIESGESVVQAKQTIKKERRIAQEEEKRRQSIPQHMEMNDNRKDEACK